MKKIVLGLLAFTLAVSGTMAQDTATAKTKRMQHPRGMHKGPRKMHGDHLKSLNLTKEQQEKVTGINKTFRAEVQALKQKESVISAKEYKAQMKDLGKKRHDQFLEVLTPAQKTQLAQQKEERMKSGQAMIKKQHEKMKAELGLTDDQSARLSSLRAETHRKAEEIRKNQALSDEQKKEQLAAVFKKQREDLRSVLTPEQLQKMESMPKPHRKNFAK